MKKTVILSAVLGIFLIGCETVQNVLNLRKPSAALKGVKLEDISLASAKLLFDIEIENPYSVALPLVNIDYGVTSNANTLFSGKANLEGIIPANSTKMVSLPAKISYMDLFNAFKGIKPGAKIPYNAVVGLSVDAPALGLIRLPLNKNGEIDVPAIPKVRDIEKMILDKVTQP